MCGVRGRIFHELEVVFNALVLCLRGTEPWMYSSCIPLKSRAGSIVFPPEPATIVYLIYVVRNICVYDMYDNRNRPRTDPPSQLDGVLGAWRTLK